MATRLPPAATAGCLPSMSSAASAAKLQLMQSPTFRSAPLTEGAFFGHGGLGGLGGFGGGRGGLGGRGAQRVGSVSFGGAGAGGGGLGLGGKKKGLEQHRAKSLPSLEVNEVRMLADDAPVKEGTEHLKNPYEALMMRLKSRAARQEAEATRKFLAAYRADGNVSQASEAKLDALLKGTTQRAEELRQRSEDLKMEVADAERKLEKVNIMNCGRASDSELSAMNAFERSQRRIQEDKREEEVQRQRDEVQANYAKVHRRHQNELIELRDFKVLLREFRRIRLEKLHDTLGKVTDGRRLRGCVREMIRHGAQRILQKLEGAQLPLEPWMNEVLVNCCHVEIRIEEAEEKLLHIRREALKPIKDDVHALLSQSKQDRFDSLCKSSMRQNDLAAAVGSALGGGGGGGVSTADAGFRRQSSVCSVLGGDEGREWSAHASTRQVADQVTQNMRAAEANIASLRRLLNDMRHNAAAVICNQIRQVEKGGGREASRDAMEWGHHMLAMLVSEDFSKQTMKELQKSAPAAKLTQ